MPDFSKEIDWNNETFLKEFLRKECDCRPFRGIEQKRIQVMDFMKGADLNKQLAFVGIEVGQERNHEKKAKLKSCINGSYSFDTSDDEDGAKTAFDGENMKEEENSDDKVGLNTRSSADGFVLLDTPTTSITTSSNIISLSSVGSENDDDLDLFKVMIKKKRYVAFSGNGATQVYDTNNLSQMDLVSSFVKKYGLDCVEFLNNESMCHPSGAKRRLSVVPDDGDLGHRVSLDCDSNVLNKPSSQQRKEVDMGWDARSAIKNGDDYVVLPHTRKTKIVETNNMKSNGGKKSRPTVPQIANRFHAASASSFARPEFNNTYILNVQISKKLVVIEPSGEDDAKVVKQVVGLSFSIQDHRNKPIFWLKMNKVAELLKNFGFPGVSPHFRNFKFHYMRKRAGGVSERLVNGKMWPEMQLFIMLNVHSDIDLESVIKVLVDEIHDFIRCAAFKEMYLEYIKDNIGLYAFIQKEKKAYFEYLNNISIEISKNKSLNSFLVDEDIRSEMVLLFGSVLSVDDMEKIEKEFFFQDSDSSQFGLSPYDSGSNHLMSTKDCKNKKQLHNWSSLRCVRKRKRLTQNLECSSLPKYFDSNDISKMKELWFVSICHGVIWGDETNLLLAHSTKDLNARMKKLSKQVMSLGRKDMHLNVNKKHFTSMLENSGWKRYSTIYSFERNMQLFGNQCCHKCRSTFVDYKPVRKIYTCRLCKHDTQLKIDSSKRIGPVWLNRNNEVRYDVPMELQNLRLGEQLLIQKYSPYIPIVHIRHGTLGTQGHCISFPKDITTLCKVLPRIDCEVIRYIRHSGNKDIGTMSKYDGFIVRKRKVIDALLFLKEFNPLYQDVVIDLNNLSWMKNCDEACLENIVDIHDNNKKNNALPSSNCNVSNVQSNQNTTDDHESKLQLQYSGAVMKTNKMHYDIKDDIIVKGIIDAVNKSGRSIPSMDFPQIKEDPVDEYTSEALFAGTFPWLFPGGVGDIVDECGHDGQNIKQWLERLIRYKDSRFERDKMFSFYANDYCERKLANGNAGYFVKNVCIQCPISLEDLIEQIENDDFSFINKLLYFAGGIKGTDSYWRRQKEQLNAWMHYHIAQKHGPPTLFLTLSCAELWWKDLQKLLSERLIATQIDELILLAKKVLCGDLNSSMKAVNMHAGLVQEYFHLRVEEWLATVGKHILNITHYWAAYEFAPGRGQIHIHMLAITKDQPEILTKYFELENDHDYQNKRVKLMSKYARDVLELTAEHPGYASRDDYDGNNLTREQYTKSLQSLYIETDDDIEDQKNLCHSVQEHYCNAFCMRKKSKQKNQSMRYCRVGGGVEKTLNSCDTPGFPLNDIDTIEFDTRGFRSLKLKRNINTRLNQSSMVMLQSWRANCDLKLLMYNTHPICPDLREIENVSGYVVAYTCKGHLTLSQEREILCTSIKSMDIPCHVGEHAVIYAAKKALNILSGRRVIGQYETMHSCLNLPLTLCSEDLVEVRISGWKQLRLKQSTSTNSKTFFTQYYLRQDCLHLSLYQYFHLLHNRNDSDKKISIPYLTGMQSTPVYPVSVNYAKSCLIKYKPWSKNTMLDFEYGGSAISELYFFLNDPCCPTILKNELTRLQSAHNPDGTKKEPTNSNIQPSNMRDDFGNDSNDEDDTDCIVTAMNSFSRMMKHSCDYLGLKFDRGVHFPWSKRLSDRDPNFNGVNWLFRQIDQIGEQRISIPTKNDGSNYYFSDLNHSQCNIGFLVMHTIMEWINYAVNNEHDNEYMFRPLRMTVSGKAGTGKSFLIHTIVTMVRQLTGYNDSVIVCAPTGASACNVHGTTIHSQFGLNPFKLHATLSMDKKLKLTNQFKRTLVLIIDERSMISSEVLGATESRLSETIYGGVCQDYQFGGMPVVLLVGDDYQLPTVVVRGKGKGAFHVFQEYNNNGYSPETMVNEANGMNLFKRLSDTVMNLSFRTRQKDDSGMIDILDDIEDGEMNKKTITALMNLKLCDLPHGEQNEIKRTATYIFAMHHDKNTHNKQQLLNICNEQNPIAHLRCQDLTVNGRYKSKHFDPKTIPLQTHICIGARVAILGRNIEPLWGIYNGAIGTVKEIVFAPNKNPNLGDLPLYVAVELPSYKPPASIPEFDDFNPKIIPIPMLQHTCKHGCCRIRFCPLVIAFGRTIHSFQGQEAGPGKPIETIVVDPGPKRFEMTNPGTLYCCITRATTMGGMYGKHSSIYFTGQNITHERFQNMTYGVDRKKYINVQHRIRWIQHLEKNRKKTEKQMAVFKREDFSNLKLFIEQKLSLHELDNIIQYHINARNYKKLG